VELLDRFWLPRQQLLHDVTVPWATRHLDNAGGLEAFKSDPDHHEADLASQTLLAVMFLEALGAVVGLRRDDAIEGLIAAWTRWLIERQSDDRYLPFGWSRASMPGAELEKRWQPVWWSHEDFAIGHYVEGSIAYLEATGDRTAYESAVRAVDQMASVLLDSDRAYAPGHAEIEQALTRLYGLTGSATYLRLCGWLIEQRGKHDGRRFGKYAQDHLPVNEQRSKVTRCGPPTSSTASPSTSPRRAMPAAAKPDPPRLRRAIPARLHAR
jgi:uncharacterized protein